MEQVRKVNRVFFITVAAAILVSFAASAIPAIRENQLFSLLLSQVVYAVPVLLYLAGSQEKPLKALRLRRVRFASVLLLVAFAYLITPLLNLLNAASMLFSTNVITSSLMGLIAEYPLWVGIAAIALLPAILEECVYRGVFFNEYRKQNPRLGILVSGLLFGLIHMNFNQFFYAFAMGIIFAFLVEAADSLLASIVVHFTINATSVLLSQTAKDAVMVYSQEELLGTIRLLLLPAIFMSACAFGVLRLIAGLEGRREAMEELFRRENKKRETVLTLPLLLGIGLCLIVMVSVELMNHIIR